MRAALKHSSSRGRAKSGAAAQRATTPATAGIPRFLHYRVPPKALAGPESQAAESEARAFARGEQTMRGVGEQCGGGTADSLARSSVAAASARLGSGTPLAAEQRTSYESRLGAILGGVRLHTDAGSGALADSVGANAFTLGQDIYFGRGKYQPGTESGEALIAHEMTHAAQHGNDASQLNADLAMSLPVTQGVFGIDMADRTAPASPGMEGHITFDPDSAGQYSAEIGLIQAVRIEAAGNTSGVGSPLHFGGAAEATRDILATTGSQFEQAGWHVDTTYSDPAKTQGAQVSPSYPESVGFSPGNNEHGFLRSPTDLKQAMLYDYPSSPRPQIKYDFETVAKGMDNQNVYGGLHWGFELLAGVPGSEYAYAVDATSREFDISLDRFRTFFTHEPVIIYFDTNVDVPMAGEDAKLDEAMLWLNEFSDAHVEIEGFADERGSTTLNAGLSQRRADSVATALRTRGLDISRIDSSAGNGKTTAFAAGRQAGQLQANRRARIRFVRNASTMPGP
jgi:outer membrane protein OmpA-like peptidoglycan-associated protein